MARVNITKQVKTQHGWRNVALARDARRRIKWTVGSGRYIIEWRENGRRQRAAAGVAPAEALEAQKRKRLELDAKQSGLEISGLDTEAESLPLQKAVETFLKDIKTFRKPLTHQKYEYVLELFVEHAAPKSDARDIAPEDIKKFLAWRKSKGFDPGTTLYTDRVILHNFFNSGSTTRSDTCRDCRNFASDPSPTPMQNSRNSLPSAMTGSGRSSP